MVQICMAKCWKKKNKKYGPCRNSFWQLPWPGFEPGLLRPQRRVLTTIRSRLLGQCWENESSKCYMNLEKEKEEGALLRTVSFLVYSINTILITQYLHYYSSPCKYAWRGRMLYVSALKHNCSTYFNEIRILNLRKKVSNKTLGKLWEAL